MPRANVAYFPEISGRDIDANGFDLPGDFGGEFNRVIIAYDRWH